MGVYISGMEMPKEGTVIAIYKLNGKFYASVHGTELCPLVPIPPHGRLVVLDRETALAIAAGCKAIRTTKRLIGASYVYDPFGENGGPYEIPYVKAGDILRKIWDEYPLDSEKAEEDEL